MLTLFHVSDVKPEMEQNFKVRDFKVLNLEYQN